jgi:putative ABC transport system substrate-binding protein
MQFDRLNRRDFITLLGGAAAWPLVARAQQSRRMRRIGALMPFAANDGQAQARNAAFLQGLQQLGWAVGHNVQIDYRWSAGSADQTRKDAAELVALTPDVIVTSRNGRSGAVASGNPQNTSRVYECRRSSWRRICRYPGAAGR